MLFKALHLETTGAPNLLRTFEIRDVEKLESYRLAWTSMWRAGRRPWFTQSLDWLAAFVKLQSDRVALRTLFVCDDEEILGIVPLVLTTESTRTGPHRTLRYPLFEGYGCCGPIGSQPTFVLLEAMQYLSRHETEWDVLDLAGINVEEVDHGRTKTALHVARIDAEIGAWQTRSMISLRTAEDSERLAMRIELLPERSRCFEYVRYRPEGAMHGDAEPKFELFDDCLSIARQSDGGPGRGATEHALLGHALVRELHATTARNGTLDVNLLYLDDAPAAFSYGYACDDEVTVIDAGLDLRFAQEHADDALAAAMLEDSLERGDRVLDLGTKPAAWLRTWSNGTRTIHRAQTARPRGIAAQVLQWGRALKGRFGDAAAF